MPLMAFRWRPQEDKDHYAHGHMFLEIIVCAKGKAVHRTNQGLIPIRQGDAAVLRPGSWHEFLDPHDTVIYNLCFKEELLHHELLEIPRDAMTHHLLWDAPRQGKHRGIFHFHLPRDMLRELHAPMDMLDRLYQDPWSGYNTQKLGGLMICLGVLARAAWASRSDAPSHPGARMHPAVKRVLHFIQQDLAYPWTLNELARRVRMNHSYLARVFRQAMRCTVLEYISNRRAETAAALLITGEEPIGEIGAKVGWDDPNYFARRFRKHFDVSAGEYRKQHRTHLSP
ncbi:MAG: helix-turn-helix domain-containing protein [Phycisphaerae bacterium]|nr:helix-turn-helix domain-containing protein [Phycisphaerae bacterium]